MTPTCPFDYGDAMSAQPLLISRLQEPHRGKMAASCAKQIISIFTNAGVSSSQSNVHAVGNL
eukprot:scaffold255647_cov15-Tisochrysis_lutea.AAC.1